MKIIAVPFSALACLAVISADLQTSALTITPQEDTSFFQITGCGFQSFYCIGSQDSSLIHAGIPSGSAYYRWTWRELEPVNGQPNFALIDSTLARAHRAGQTLEFRIMNVMDGSVPVAIPQWLVDKGVALRQIPCEGNPYTPDFDDDTVKFYMFRLLRSLGNRYDGHPDLGSLDIGEIGLWGEGHVYCDKSLMPSAATQRAIVDSVYAAFPNTPLTIGQDLGTSDNTFDLVASTIPKGRCGWRADCWGTCWSCWGPGQGFMSTYQATNDKVPAAWQNGPVCLESCGIMSDTSYWNLSMIDSCFSQTLSWHVSMAENKSAAIPAQIVAKTRAFAKKLGFRLVLRSVTCNDRVRPGANLALAMNWENLGNAPPYRDLRIAFRLKNGSGKASAAAISAQSVQQWLPGAKSVTVTYPLPSTVSVGTYTLETALAFHSAIDRLAAIAVKGRTSDGWYPLGSLAIDTNASVAQLSPTHSPQHHVQVRTRSGRLIILDPPGFAACGGCALYSINGDRITLEHDTINGILIHCPLPGVYVLGYSDQGRRQFRRVIIDR